jgi:hypothetical protein
MKYLLILLLATNSHAFISAAQAKTKAVQGQSNEKKAAEQEYQKERREYFDEVDSRIDSAASRGHTATLVTLPYGNPSFVSELWTILSHEGYWVNFDWCDMERTEECMFMDWDGK